MKLISLHVIFVGLLLNPALHSQGLSRGTGVGRPPTARYLGSYFETVKESAISSQDDAPALVAALGETGQNLFGYRADDGVTGNSVAGHRWPKFLEILGETRGQGIQIFAVVAPPHTTYSVNRWGVDGNDPLSSWKAAFVAAAEEFSLLSQTYPHFVGFTIDDFGHYVDSAATLPTDEVLTKADVGAIRAAAHTYNLDFEFWPTIYYVEMGALITEGLVLGSRYGVRMRAEEYAAAEVRFTLPAAPTEARLTFFHHDDNAEDTDYVDRLRKSLEVNGNPGFDRSLREDTYVERFDEDIAAQLHTGENVIRFQLSTTATCNIYHKKLFYVWDLELQVDGTVVTPSSITFDEYESTGQYVDNLGQTVNNVGRIVSASNAPYLLGSAVDGILAPYRAADQYYAVDSFRELLSSTKAALGTGDLIAVHYARSWGTFIDPLVLSEQIDEAARIADGVVLFAYPLGLAYLEEQEGIFSQRVSDDAAFPLMAYWPGYQTGLEGWYQKWSSRVVLSGTVSVSVKDSRTTAYSTAYFLKRVSALETGAVFYSDDIAGNEGEETLIIDLGATPVTLVLHMEATANVGNLAVATYFKVTDASGTVLGAEDWSFDSGTTEAALLDVFQRVSTLYHDLWNETCLRVTLDQPAGPGTGVFVDNRNMIPGHEYYTIFSLTPCPVVGTGSYLGLCAPDPAVLLAQLMLPIGTPPFHFMATARREMWGPFAVPPLTLEAVCFDLTGGTIGAVSRVTRFPVQ